VPAVVAFGVAAAGEDRHPGIKAHQVAVRKSPHRLGLDQMGPAAHRVMDF
jgi:hypothetical protein